MVFTLEPFLVPGVFTPKWEFYLLYEDGNSDVADYLAELQSSDYAKVQARLRIFATQGWIPDKTKFRKVTGYEDLFEFKVFGVRLFCFLSEKPKCIITEGCGKQSTQSRSENIEAYRRADRRRVAFLAQRAQ